jgi:hypothetical protein
MGPPIGTEMRCEGSGRTTTANASHQLAFSSRLKIRRTGYGGRCVMNLSYMRRARHKICMRQQNSQNLSENDIQEKRGHRGTNKAIYHQRTQRYQHNLFEIFFQEETTIALAIA